MPPKPKPMPPTWAGERPRACNGGCHAVDTTGGSVRVSIMLRSVDLAETSSRFPAAPKMKEGDGLTEHVRGSLSTSRLPHQISVSSPSAATLLDGSPSASLRQTMRIEVMIKSVSSYPICAVFRHRGDPTNRFW